MKEWFRKLFRGRILSSLFYIALGLLLILMPNESVNFICKIVFGVVLMITGAYHILIHLFELNNATILDLFSGVILTVLGVFLFMNPILVIKIFPIFLGGFVLVDSIWTLKGAFRLKKRQRGSWKFVFPFGLVFMAAGVVLIVNPFTVVKQMIMFAGGALAASGVLDILFSIIMFLGFRKADKEEKAQLAAEAEHLEETAPEEKKDTKDSGDDFVSEESVYEDWKEAQNKEPEHTYVPELVLDSEIVQTEETKDAE